MTPPPHTHTFSLFFLGQRHAIRVPGHPIPADFGAHRHFDYAPAIYKQVAKLKVELGLRKTYVAVHWR